MNYTSITLGELLSSENETIRRNAVSILKQFQKEKKEVPWNKVYNPITKRWINDNREE